MHFSGNTPKRGRTSTELYRVHKCNQVERLYQGQLSTCRRDQSRSNYLGPSYDYFFQKV